MLQRCRDRSISVSGIRVAAYRKISHYFSAAVSISDLAIHWKSGLSYSKVAIIDNFKTPPPLFSSIDVDMPATGPRIYELFVWLMHFLRLF